MYKIGINIKNSSLQTCKVLVTHEYYTQHSLKPQIQYRSFLIHDPRTESSLGDIILARAIKPISKKKHFKLVKLLSAKHSTPTLKKKRRKEKKNLKTKQLFQKSIFYRSFAFINKKHLQKKWSPNIWYLWFILKNKPSSLYQDIIKSFFDNGLVSNPSYFGLDLQTVKQQLTVNLFPWKGNHWVKTSYWESWRKKNPSFFADSNQFFIDNKSI